MRRRLREASTGDGRKHHAVSTSKGAFEEGERVRVAWDDDQLLVEDLLGEKHVFDAAAAKGRWISIEPRDHGVTVELTSESAPAAPVADDQPAPPAAHAAWQSTPVIVKVSRAEVLAAQTIVEHNTERGVTSPPAVLALAHAQLPDDTGRRSP